MADTHHKPETCTATTATSKSRAHYYRIGYRPNELNIKGRWLEALGLTTGQKIGIITGPGQLIIQRAAEG
ncbi:toxic protein SymE [Candidatus Pantoea varia]|uniref:Toxic protein SymE n=1 Tax=Candidatus Pantoea varia TaxID=1881036 RepID=A0A1I5GX73_9GAMM|nr:SymE family type I addiction module toxin [Pantoea varia]SFO40416.1 toxic protein SymE [Pantoea varia]